MWIGGLSERLKGMVTIYKICKGIGFEYKIWHYYPFDLSLYLQPNKVDWYMAKEDIDIDKRTVDVIAIPSLSLGMSKEETVSYYVDYLSSRIKTITKYTRQKHVYTNATIVDKEEYSKLFKELFKPSEDLQRQVDWNLQQIGGEFVSVTTRFQNLMGDFKDGKAKALDTEEEKQEYIKKCIGKVEEIHGMHPDKKVLVTSDSARFIEEVKKLPYVYVIPGKIGHVDYSPSSAHDVHIKAFVDMLTLSEASKLYYIVTGKMYRGKFAWTASYIGNKPYEDIIF